MVHSAVRRLPRDRVNHADGICAICAANGSAPRMPTRTGVRPRYSAHAVIAPPLAHAPTSSATIPSATEIRNVRRTALCPVGGKQRDRRTLAWVARKGILVWGERTGPGEPLSDRLPHGGVRPTIPACRGGPYLWRKRR